MKSIGKNRFYFEEQKEIIKSDESSMLEIEQSLFNNSFIISRADLVLVQKLGFKEIETPYSFAVNAIEKIDISLFEHVKGGMYFVRIENNLITELHFTQFTFGDTEDHRVFYKLKYISKYDVEKKCFVNHNKNSVIFYDDYGDIEINLKLIDNKEHWYFNLSNDHYHYVSSSDNFYCSFIKMKSKRIVEDFSFVCHEKNIDSKIFKEIFGCQNFNVSTLLNFHKKVSPEDIDVLRMVSL